MMKENRLLFKVKSIEKMILRTFIHESDYELKEKGVIPTPTQMQIMEYILFKSNGEVLQKELENVLNLRRATVSGVLQTMEKNRLIERVIDNGDARTKKIILNADAKKLFLEREKEIERIEKIIIQGISKEELEVFSRVLEQMKNNIKKEVEKVATKGGKE